MALWKGRLDRATTLLKGAGLRTVDRSAAWTRYAELRTEWNGLIHNLAPSMLYSMEEIDAATYGTGKRDGVADNGINAPTAHIATNRATNRKL
jgi:hypothetical protein